MTRFAQAGNQFRIAGDHPPALLEKLPPGNFIINFHPEIGFYLTQAENFTLPPKIYGSHTRQRDRILGTFKDREQSTGVMLTGEKGSGKTLLAKDLAVTLAEQDDAPTLIVNAAYRGDSFSEFLSAIEQPALVMFDEFEKVYNMSQGEQDALLTLLDGVFPTKKLFVLTCNDKYKVNMQMKNRPGRVYYMLEFGGLEKEFIEEYAKDTLRENLHNFIPKLVALGESFEAFNFDMLKAVCEEMNRYCEEPKDALRMLNIKPDRFMTQRYDIKLFLDGKEVPRARMMSTSITVDPNAPFRCSVNFRHILSRESLEECQEQAKEHIGKKGTPEMYERVLGNIVRDREGRSVVFCQDDFVRPDPATKSLIYTKRSQSMEAVDEIFSEQILLRKDEWKEATLWLVKAEKSSLEVAHPYDYL